MAGLLEEGPRGHSANPPMHFSQARPPKQAMTSNHHSALLHRAWWPHIGRPPLFCRCVSCLSSGPQWPLLGPSESSDSMDWTCLPPNPHDRPRRHACASLAAAILQSLVSLGIEPPSSTAPLPCSATAIFTLAPEPGQCSHKAVIITARICSRATVSDVPMGPSHLPGHHHLPWAVDLKLATARMDSWPPRPIVAMRRAFLTQGQWPRPKRYSSARYGRQSVFLFLFVIIATCGFPEDSRLVRHVGEVRTYFRVGSQAWFPLPLLGLCDTPCSPATMSLDSQCPVLLTRGRFSQLMRSLGAVAFDLRLS